MKSATRQRWARPIGFALCALLITGAAACELGEEEAPAISWTAMRPHRDEGACTHCHTRLDLRGNPIPTITSASRMPHMDRGVCSNCHRIEVGHTSGALAPVAGLRSLPSGVQTQGSLPTQGQLAPTGPSPSAF